MKRRVFVLATLTLSSALYAQSALTLEQAREIVAQYNSNLLERASQNTQLQAWVDQLLSSYVAQQIPDSLESRYTLAALARNFDNSLALNEATDQYAQAVYYSQVGQDVQPQARAAAAQVLQTVFPRVWAVSVQIKEELLSQYKQAKAQVKKNQELDHAAQEQRLTQLNQSIRALQEDLKILNTQVGPQLYWLTQHTLDNTQARVLQALAQEKQLAAAQTENLQIKSKHKKPVAQ